MVGDARGAVLVETAKSPVGDALRRRRVEVSTNNDVKKRVIHNKK